MMEQAIDMTAVIEAAKSIRDGWELLCKVHPRGVIGMNASKSSKELYIQVHDKKTFDAIPGDMVFMYSQFRTENPWEAIKQHDGFKFIKVLTAEEKAAYDAEVQDYQI